MPYTHAKQDVFIICNLLIRVHPSEPMPPKISYRRSRLLWTWRIKIGWSSHETVCKQQYWQWISTEKTALSNVHTVSQEVFWPKIFNTTSFVCVMGHLTWKDPSSVSQIYFQQTTNKKAVFPYQSESC